MSTLAVDAIVDSSNGNTTTINGTTPTAYNTMGKNRIINGAMEIDQRNAGAVVSTASVNPYTVDRWQVVSNPASKFTAQQNAGSVTPPEGFTNYLGITSSSAYSSASGDQMYILHNFEGHSVADLGFGTANAKTVTISFKVYSSLTGTFGACLRNYGSTRSYPFTYTISSANTWTSISVTIPGDTSGTWVGASNAGSMILFFNLGSGSTYEGTPGAWASADYRSATGATSVVGTNGATFYITGVQLEVGSTATEFERRPYGTELALCQRYYQHSYATGTAVGTATSVGAAHFGGGQNGSTTGYLAGPWILFPVQLRTFPTITVWDIGGNSGVCHRFTYAVGGANSQSYSIAATSDKSIYGYSSGSTNYAGVSIHWRAEAEL